MVHHNIPGISGIDTRALTQKIREHGVMLGRMKNEECPHPNPLPKGEGTTNYLPAEALAKAGQLPATNSFQDPNDINLVAEVSCTDIITYEPEKKEEGVEPKTIVVYDCGIKRGILRSWLARGVRVHRVPWNYDLKNSSLQYDGLFISNGPGDPKKCTETISHIQWAIEKKIPTFGICLGNQLLALAIGGDTYKLKYGHRGLNQPCIEWKDGKATDRCIITSQNHGFAVDASKLPVGWNVWFTNANDGTVEGIRHNSGRFFSVQFHPEATPGPEDAAYLFDEFLGVL
jgi:carbamoyl-phosphate synthase small subunit